MDQRVVDFLTKERMCALTICLPDGSPHSAAMHFVYQGGVLYFSTAGTSKKAQGLTKTKASVAVGFSEQDWITLQMDGEIEKVVEGKDIILGKYPETTDRITETSIFMKFTPTWWRYSEFKTNVYLES